MYLETYVHVKIVPSPTIFDRHMTLILNKSEEFAGVSACLEVLHTLTRICVSLGWTVFIGHLSTRKAASALYRTHSKPVSGKIRPCEVV